MGAAANICSMSDKSQIETSLGPVWITRFENGDISVWSPPRSEQADLVADILKGRAAWKPKYRAWFVPPVHVETVLAELENA
ncbi:hypothetical protein GCM10010990_34640 [Croceicoccus mobilis]|uniref:Uncharacterized protein n=2 Tax=Croceicoccus mobilis TaxID=1703339 RepID=A0A916Z9T8_9SPHN|nr:hypothetical protein GCM10010990_34640 [Croceicoccus mobilis]